jgi:hypothetical protein
MNVAHAGPWNPGIRSEVPRELRHLSTIFRPEHVSTSLAAAVELRQLTGLAASELVAFRPRRLMLHELLIRVTANFRVPDGSRIEDLGINFREMTGLILKRYLEPQMDALSGAFDATREQIREAIEGALADVVARANSSSAIPTQSKIGGLFARFARRRTEARPPSHAFTWGPRQIAECERMAGAASDPVMSVACRCLARVMSALFTTNGRAWGTRELIVSLATDMASNIHGSDVIGRMIEPILQYAAQQERFVLLPRQEEPVVINTKGASASGKSTLRPLQKKLAGNIGVSWSDFALISPDIWRKQLLEYGSLGPAYKYAGAFTSEELQIIDQKLDRYMALKSERGDITHLLIDRFRFDSFAPDSDEAGSNLLTRFGHTVYLFFMITPPESLVERAWNRGLEFGRYKAVDDTLAHSVQAYTGMPDVFFTWIKRADKRIQFEFLDNSVRLGDLPRTVAFGTNHTLNVLDIKAFLDIVRYGRVNIEATDPASIYADPRLLEPEHNMAFLQRCVIGFPEVNFADQASARIYLSMASGKPVMVDSEALQAAVASPDTLAGLRTVAPGAFDGALEEADRPRYLSKFEAGRAVSTLGQWGTAAA